MDRSHLCGCKGYRTCLICEKEYGVDYGNNPILPIGKTYTYCPECNLCWPINEDHRCHETTTKVDSIEFPGVYIGLSFLTDAEEQALIDGIDSMPWDLSQSGRRKQNFGPKCNFKKKKLRTGDFCGFPKFSKFVQDKFSEVPLLKDFQTIEQCSLEYDPKRGASIDPHIDDCWIWGERIVTLNLLSDSVLTMTYNKKSNSYNLDCVEQYPSIVASNGKPFCIEEYKKDCDYPIVQLPMPRKSLMVLYGSARYEWEHRVLREDIHERRVCLAYREFTPPYLAGGCKFDEAEDIFRKAELFFSSGGEFTL